MTMEEIHEAAREAPQRIVLSEGEDPRVQAAAVLARRAGTAEPVLVGRTSVVRQGLRKLETSGPAFAIHDPEDAGGHSALARLYLDLRKHKGADEAQAALAVRNPLNLAALLVRSGRAAGCIGGAVATTGDTIRAALQIIGAAPGITTVSSVMLLLPHEISQTGTEPLCFADCALVAEPDLNELAQIAISSADSFQALTGLEPRVAMLSFSTYGSARHARAQHVAQATRLAKTLRPELDIDGELQFDAAVIPDVAAAKAPSSTVAGRANVLVFPDLAAANIGYKIAQRLGGAIAVGPILQGLNQPANDLSRGCSAADIFNLISITSLQAAARAASQHLEHPLPDELDLPRV